LSKEQQNFAGITGRHQAVVTWNAFGPSSLSALLLLSDGWL